MPTIKRPPVTRTDGLLALAALAGGLLLIAARGYAVWWGDADPGRGWRLVVLLGLAAMVPFRRTAPRTALALATPFELADVVMGPGFVPAVVYGDLLYAAGLYGRRRTAERLLATTTAMALTVTVAVGVAVSTVSGAVVAGAIAVMSWVLPVLSAMAVREHRLTARAERARAEQVARLAELDRRSAVSAERARMARELHDVIANHLSAVALHSSAVLKMPHLDRDGVTRAMEVIRENSVQGLDEMRRMIGLLREGEAEDPRAEPRLDGLDRLVAQASRADLTAELKVEGERPDLPAAVELAAYRIVQESLTNALKHGGRGTALVRVAFCPGRVVVEVTSPLGPDGERLPGAGAGLIGMRERAAMVDGTFEAGPEGGEWRVRAELPTGPRAAVEGNDA
ncbi:two-component sensor histidine kinase [Actinomadura sp. NBRC 104412]|uniref:sensor histidine kinase n=1 Tax=Actinomadura sp. NBRC 104412 TaxID=3032203 RepID=UPI0024A5A930|nr:histidine kinase [Actinomadura sp. NBRC 104412]GLZ06695.1 two-component sensor histidine kinase [Actinomadura sp. NBRC 104412]